MQILLFRHGIAEDVGPDGDDASRRLTEEGFDKTKDASRGLVSIIDKPDVLLTSPLVRARQTADILGKQLGMSPQVLDSLAHGPAAAVLRDLGKRRESSIALVGHEPTLSQLAELLCTAGEAGEFIQLKKAGAILIESTGKSIEKSRGKLVFVATSAMLRATAK